MSVAMEDDLPDQSEKLFQLPVNLEELSLGKSRKEEGGPHSTCVGAKTCTATSGNRAQ